MSENRLSSPLFIHPPPPNQTHESLAGAETRPYFEIVRDELSRLMQDGGLSPGVVLLEGPIATLLGVSRGPVKRALELLAEQRLIQRFEGRGYLVGRPGVKQTPKRVNLLTLDLDVSGEIQAYAQRASWQKLYAEVAESVVDCLPFGAYKISESAICAHFDVSRTVVRDVLARLNHDGLIEKDRWSHWTAGPLTARDVNEHFEMRLLLEPKALALAAPALARVEIEAMLRRLDEAAAAKTPTSDQIKQIERDLHETCLAGLTNRRMSAAVQQSRTPHVINRLFAAQVLEPEVGKVLEEHRRVLEGLHSGASAKACEALRSHIEAARQRTRARLKVLSVLTARNIPKYLTPIVDGQSPPALAASNPPARRGKASARPILRVLGRSEILLEPIRRIAKKDLGFDIRFEMIEGVEELQRAVTRPDTFDVYHQWHTVDLLWTSRSIQPIEIERIAGWREIAALANLSRGGAPVCGDMFRQLYVQPDGQLDAKASPLASMLPTIHGTDSLGYLASIRSQFHSGELESWGWLLDERWRGKVAMLRDPTLGMIEAALAIEGAGLMRFNDLANLSIEEIDAIMVILKEKKRNGHFRGLWETYEDSVKLMERGGVVVQSMFSPALTALKRRGLEVVSATPVEGCRGWHSDICVSSRAEGAALDAAYAYLNWWMNGPAGAILGRQGYYMAARDLTRRYLSDAEWEYWYEGKPATTDLPDPYGEVCVHAGDIRSGGSYIDRMEQVRVWNTVMDDHNYLARRWNEFLNA